MHPIERKLKGQGHVGNKYSNYSNEYDLKGDIYRASTNHNFMIA